MRQGWDTYFFLYLMKLFIFGKRNQTRPRKRRILCCSRCKWAMAVNGQRRQINRFVMQEQGPPGNFANLASSSFIDKTSCWWFRTLAEQRNKYFCLLFHLAVFPFDCEELPQPGRNSYEILLLYPGASLDCCPINSNSRGDVLGCP